MSRVISAILTLKDKDFSTNMKRASSRLGDLDRKLTYSTNQIRRYKDTAVSSFAEVAKGVGGLVAAYAGFEAVKGIFTSSIEAASSLEGYRNTLNVVMKDQQKAAETMKWAVDFANKTPFETDSVVQATVRLQSYGLEAKKVLPAIGDMAGVMNKDVMQAVEAVADAQTGELERLKEFGITKAMIAKKAGEMYKNQEIINNKGQIVQQEKFNEALFALMNDRFKGGMDTQANSFKGLMSTVTGVWKTGLATMAGISATGEIVKGSLFDILKNKAKSLGETMTRMAEDGTFESIGKGISKGINFASTSFTVMKNGVVWLMDKAKPLGNWFVDAFKRIRQSVAENQPTIEGVKGVLLDLGDKAIVVKDWLVGAFRDAQPFILWVKNEGLPNIVDGVASVIDKASGLYNFINDNWTAIEPIIMGIAGGLLFYKGAIATVQMATLLYMGVLKGLTLAQGALNFVMSISPLGWIAIAIGAVIAVGVLLWRNWDTISVKAGELWNGLKGAFAGIGQGFSDMWSGMKSTAKSGVNYVIDGVNSMIQSFNSFASFKVPDWVPVIGGKSWEASIPTIPQFALGTSYFSGGIARINERGGEIVDLPTGSRVYPHDKSVQMAKQEGKSITNHIYINASSSVDEIINELVPKLKLTIANM